MFSFEKQGSAESLFRGLLHQHAELEKGAGNEELT